MFAAVWFPIKIVTGAHHNKSMPVQPTGRSSRFGRAWASHVGDREFGSQSSQANDLKMYTCRFLAWCLALIG